MEGSGFLVEVSGCCPLEQLFPFFFSHRIFRACWFDVELALMKENAGFVK